MCSAIRRGRNRHLESFARVAAPLPWPAPNPREQIKNTPPRRIAFAQVCVPLLIPSTCPLSVPHLPFPRLITLPSPSPNLVLKKRRRPRASATATSRVSHGRLRLSRGLRPGRASKQKNNPPRRVAFAQGFTQRDKTTESEVLAREQRQKRATATRRPVTRVACHLAADRALWCIKLICVQFTLSAI